MHSKRTHFSSVAISSACSDTCFMFVADEMLQSFWKTWGAFRIVLNVNVC